ncbi:MAG: hypothetical protein IJ311_02115 [Elusimicrobiaceae bacterium]|nr:hypothetical protein [Elusimicrobiaceae bacterium]
MWELAAILIFVLLLSFPGFYIITRKIFPRGSKRSAAWISGLVTFVFLALMLALMFGAML